MGLAKQSDVRIGTFGRLWLLTVLALVVGRGCDCDNDAQGGGCGVIDFSGGGGSGYSSTPPSGCGPSFACDPSVAASCGAGQVCDPASDTCISGCYSDQDCLPGYVCLDPDAGYVSWCVQGCSIDGACPDGSVCTDASDIPMCMPTLGDAGTADVDASSSEAGVNEAGDARVNGDAEGGADAVADAPFDAPSEP